MSIRKDYRQEEWWSHEELAHHANVKIGTVYRWVSDGKVETRSHTNHRIKRDSALELLSE